MAFSALKPCSRIMRASPHQSDQQEKKSLNLLLLQEEKHAELNEEEDEEATPHRKSFTCEDPPSRHEPDLSSYNCSGLSSESTSPVSQLPTFIAPQGLHSLQLPLRKECTRSRFTKHDRNGRHLVPRCEAEEYFSHSFRDVSVPVSDFCQLPARSSIRSKLRSKPKKPTSEIHDHAKHSLHGPKRYGSVNGGGVYGLAFDQSMPIHEPREEKKRHSSACARDMISRKDVAMITSRFCDVQPSSWEEEVRQAMAKSSLGRRQNNVVCKGGAVAGGLQRSISGREQYGSSALPSLTVKQTDGPGNVDAVTICADEMVHGTKLIQDTKASGRVCFSSRGIVEEKRMWKGFSVMKSPSEERWEEAAENEARQEMQRRARSQSMRYDTHLRASDLAGIGKSDATCAFYTEEPDWAVYTRSGYMNMCPRKSDADAHQACCSSLMGRSASMRDTRMGLVMECAACGTSLHGAGGRLLCFCSCCAAARSSTMEATPSAQSKKKGARSGILRACRRLLGLSKKSVGGNV